MGLKRALNFMLLLFTMRSHCWKNEFKDYGPENVAMNKLNYNLFIVTTKVSQFAQIQKHFISLNFMDFVHKSTFLEYKSLIPSKKITP